MSLACIFRFRIIRIDSTFCIVIYEKHFGLFYKTSLIWLSGQSYSNRSLSPLPIGSCLAYCTLLSIIPLLSHWLVAMFYTSCCIFTHTRHSTSHPTAFSASWLLYPTPLLLCPFRHILLHLLLVLPPSPLPLLSCTTWSSPPRQVWCWCFCLLAPSPAFVSHGLPKLGPKRGWISDIEHLPATFK